MKSQYSRNAEIMVVDDNRESLGLLTTLLKQNGYRIRPADSGELALASLQNQKPDLIILDVKMPGINGFEVCKRIKSDPSISDIPVIFVTALNDTEAKVEGFRVGGTDFIVKPYQEEEVISRVRNQLEIFFLRKELEQTNQNLFNERELLRTTLMSIGDGVICTDTEARVTMMNEVAKDLTGWHSDSSIGQDFSTVFNIINEYTREPAFNPVKKVLETGNIIGLANHTILIARDGHERPIADSASPIRNSKGRSVGVVLVFRDVTYEKEHLCKIEYLSFHDHLTGLYNRRFFEKEMKRLDTARRLPLTMIMGDLNGLKMTNDAFGHTAGDNLLRLSADILKKCLREDDIFCRYGGDEFVIILPNTDSLMAESLVLRILSEIREAKPEKGILSISFGWDTKTSEGQDILQILKNAEDFMYKKKLMIKPSI
ncbi:MAG: diguanylate cyclase, partial [Peptococcaceae bacterium]|nr:diguanylate cyclase [Peptococcaceae bacterium]